MFTTLRQLIIGITSGRLLGRYSAAVGACEEITLGTGLSLSPEGVLDVEGVVISGTTTTAFTGYLKGNGSNVVSTATIPYSDVTGGPTATSPGGSSGQVQYNNAGAFGGVVGVVWSSSSPNLTVTAQSSAHTALRAKAAASHGATTPIFDVVNASNTRIFSVVPSSVIVGTDVSLDLPASSDGAGATGRNSIRTGYGAMYLRSGNTDNVVISAGLLQISGGVTESIIQCGDRGASLTLKVIDHYGNLNTAGKDLTYQAGRPTGTGSSGSHKFQVAPSPGVSGTTFGTLVTSAEIDASTTAGGTRFLLWDIDTGSLKRVFLGANDSGGVGYKMLRVVN